MQLDNRAYEFMKLAKQNGLSKEETFAFLQNKGYDLGLQPTQPTQQVQGFPADQYSGADKAKYTTRAAIEGATLGLGDIVAGGTNVLASDLAQVTHGQSFGDRVKAAGRLLTTFNPVNAPISSITTLRRPEFKEGRREFLTEQEEFAKSHPYMNIGGELVGGLLTGGLGGGGKAIASQAGKQGIKALANEGARQGAIYGGLYGAGSGLTEEADKLSVENALKGGIGGTIGGAAFGAVAPLGVLAAVKTIKGTDRVRKAVFRKIKNEMSKANDKLGEAGYAMAEGENPVFLDLLEKNPEGTLKSIESGEPLIVNANRKQLRRTRGAVVTSDNADEAFINAKSKFDKGKIAKGEELTGKMLGQESGYTATDKIAEEASSRYKPLYNEVMASGEIELPKEITANETIFNAIKEANQRPGYKNFNINDVRVLDKAKRVLSDKYSKLAKAGVKDEAKEFEIARQELVNFLDSKLPKYPQARKAFMEGAELKEFVELGRNISKISHAEVERIAKTLTDEQKKALKAGLGDSIRQIIYNTKKEGEALLEKAFPEPLRRKMKVLGIDDAEINKEINKEIRTNQNYQFINSGSNTANKLADVEGIGPFGGIARTIQAIAHPVKTAQNLADSADNLLSGMNSEEIVRLMFDPQALAREAQKPQHRSQIVRILREAKKGKYEVNNRKIFDILKGKIKEKGGYAMKPLDKTVNSLGEPVAKTEEGIKNFNKWFKGSKVVDENGQPLVVYHGTEANFDAFDMSKGRANMDIQGAFFSPWELDAKGYGRNIKPVYLDIKNPADEATGYKALKKFQGQNNAGKKAKEYLKSLGYDGVINNNEEYIAFEPNQIKSVKNIGKFDPKNPNIYKSLIGGLGISQILKNKEGK